MARHAHGVRISGAGIGMDLIIAGGMMLCQIDLTGPVPVRLLFRIVPGQVILSVLHAPDSELDLGMAVAGHIGHLDSQDIVILYRRHGMILLGPTDDIHRAAAVVAVRNLRLSTDAVFGADRIVGEPVGDGLDDVDRSTSDEIRAVIGVDLVSPQILIDAHGNLNDPGFIRLLFAAEPLQVILTILLTPHGDPAICEGLALHRRESDRQHAAVVAQTRFDRTPHTAVLIEVAPAIAQARNKAPAGDHCTIICAVFIRLEVVGVVTDLCDAEGHLAVVIVVGLAVGLLDKAGMSADDLTVVKHERNLIDHLLAVIGHAVFIEAVVVLFHQEPTGLRDAAQEVHLAAGGFVTSPAGVVPLNGINGGMAVVAYQLAAAADGVRQLMALFGAAAGQRLEGQTVQKLLAAVSQNIIDVDRHLGLGRFHAQIDRVEATIRLCKDLLVIEDILTVDSIGLLAAGAANVVVHAVLGVDLAALQGVGAGEGVVMAGEHHIDAGCLRRRRDILGHGGVAAGGVGVVGGLVDREDLPGGVALLGILHQPLRRCLHVAADTAVVDNSHIDVAIGGGPAAAHAVFRQGEHAAGDVGIAVALKLVVAQDVDHIGTAQLCGVQQSDHIVQLGKLRGLIHSVAGLDAKVIVAGSQFLEDAGDVGQIIGLDVSQHEELLGRAGRADGEALRRLRPVITGGHLIFIGRACNQAAQCDAVHIRRLVAACNKGAQLRCRRNGGSPVLSPMHAPAQELSLRYRWIGHPGDVLRRTSVLRGVEEERGLLDCHRIVGIDLIAHGQTPIGVLSIDGDHAGGIEGIAGQRTVFTGRSQLRIVLLEDLCVSYRLTLQIGHRQHGALAGQHRTTGHADGCAHRQRHRRGGEGHQVTVHVVAHTGLDLIEERAAGRQAGGYLHPHRGDQVAILDGTATGAHSLDGDGAILCVVAIRGVIALRGLEILGECHGAVGILPIQTDDRVALADGAVGAPNLQGHIAAHGGHGLHTGHADRVFRIAVRHGEVAGLGGLVAETVAERHRDGMCAVGELHLIQIDVTVASHQHSLVCHVDAVHIEPHGAAVHAGSVFTGCITERGAQIEGTAVDRAAVWQFFVVKGDGVHLRVVDIIRIRAVHKLEIIQIDRPNPGFDHLSACNKHEPEGHSLHQAEGGIRRFQLGLAVFPSLPVDTGLLAIRLMVWVDNGFRLKGVVKLYLVSVFIKRISPQPKAGICSIALPRNADALRGIDPYAKACRSAWNRQVICSAYACSLSYRSALAEVEVQLHRFRSEAHRFSIVNTDDLDGLIST